MHVLLWIVAVVAVLLALGRLVAHRASPPEERSQRRDKPRTRASAESTTPPDQAVLPDEDTWTILVHKAPAAPDPAPSDINVGEVEPMPPDDSWTTQVHRKAPAAPHPAPPDIKLREVDRIGPAGQSALDPLPQRPTAPEAKEQSEVLRKQLQIELVPGSMHKKNLRAVVGPDLWSLVRNITMRSDGKRCVECGSAARPECHEEWDYCQAPIRVMKLRRLRTLCHLCHMAKHIRFARIKGEYAPVQAHVEAVYGLTKADFLNLEHRAIQRVRQLDEDGAYELDLTYMNDDRFLWVRHHLGRNFGAAELENCIHRVSDDELVS